MSFCHLAIWCYIFLTQKQLWSCALIPAVLQDYQGVEIGGRNWSLVIDSSGNLSYLSNLGGYRPGAMWGLCLGFHICSPSPIRTNIWKLFGVAFITYMWLLTSMVSNYKRSSKCRYEKVFGPKVDSQDSLRKEETCATGAVYKCMCRVIQYWIWNLNQIHSRIPFLGKEKLIWILRTIFATPFEGWS